jgi:hypothetical protein
MVSLRLNSYTYHSAIDYFSTLSSTDSSSLWNDVDTCHRSICTFPLWSLEVMFFCCDRDSNIQKQYFGSCTKILYLEISMFLSWVYPNLGLLLSSLKLIDVFWIRQLCHDDGLDRAVDFVPWR